MTNVNAMATLASRLRQARKDAGKTLEEVAASIGAASYGVVSRWESDSKSGREPDASTLSRLADLYGVTVDELLGRSSTKTSPGYLEDESDDSSLAARGLVLDDPTPLGRSPAPASPVEGATPDRPAWVEDLVAAEQGTEAAIRWQADIFCGEMKDLNQRMERRDARTDTLLEGLMGALDRNTSTIAGNTETTKQASEVMSRAINLIEAQAATIDALQSRLDAYEAGPGDTRRLSTEDEDKEQWGKRGLKIQGRITSEGGEASA